MAEKKMKIGEILVASGVIKEEQLAEALRSQGQLGGTLGENLIRMASLTEEELANPSPNRWGCSTSTSPRSKFPSRCNGWSRWKPSAFVACFPSGSRGNAWWSGWSTLRTFPP